jgi:hypothetical protein
VSRPLVSLAEHAGADERTSPQAGHRLEVRMAR